MLGEVVDDADDGSFMKNLMEVYISISDLGYSNRETGLHGRFARADMEVNRSWWHRRARREGILETVMPHVIKLLRCFD